MTRLEAIQAMLRGEKVANDALLVKCLYFDEMIGGFRYVKPSGASNHPAIHSLYRSDGYYIYNEEEQEQNNAPKNKKVYICTPLKEEKFKINLIQTQILRNQVFAFIPPSHQLNSKKLGAATDKLMIENCDEVWVFGLFGRDCGWEIGYAQGLKKPVKLFITKDNEEILNTDWMTFCAGTEVIDLR